MRFQIVGAGLSGCVVARQMAENGHDVEIVEARSHLGGNCHSYEGPTGVEIHSYGPHIFHTDQLEVWEYVNKFVEMTPYSHQVMATTDSGVYSLPINLHTINQFFNQSWSPQECEHAMTSLRREAQGTSFEERGRAALGDNLYENFFKYYTEKQWGRSASDIPGDVFARLPIRFTYGTSYFNHPYQGLPAQGYTLLFERLVDHPGISVFLNSPFRLNERDKSSVLIFTGPVDRLFDYSEGRLAYRTVKFDLSEVDSPGLGCAQMNFCSNSVDYTRKTDFGFLTPNWTGSKTVVATEHSFETTAEDEPYYPVRDGESLSMLEEYQLRVSKEKKLYTLGRLGSYRYLDMDKTIFEALRFSENLLEEWA